MTSPMFVTADMVRDYLTLEPDATSRYTDATIQSNIRAASEFLEMATHRYFENRTGVTLRFTTNGHPIVDLPGVRSITSVSHGGISLVADESYWLVPDVQQTGVYSAIQLRPFAARTDGPWYRSIPEWFDRNLDSNWYGYGYSGLPNDLVVVADVGYEVPPDQLLLATKVLAAFFTVRPGALLSGAFTTGGWIGIPLDELPVEVRMFVLEWRIGFHTAVSL